MIAAVPEVPGAWLAVASAAHVRRGRAEGFMQVCHGKAAPLRRIQPGDGIVYYSPTTTLGIADGLKAFTAIGLVSDRAIRQIDMGAGFRPFRRDVDWYEGFETPVGGLSETLDLTAEKNWGYQLRFGLLALSLADWHRIGAEMLPQAASAGRTR